VRLAPRLAAPIAMLALVAAGCGGTQVAYEQVPGDPPQLTTPGTAEAFAPTATPTPTETPADTTADTSATPTATPAAGATTTPQTSTGDTSTGGAAATGTTDGSTNDQPPPAGSPAQQFEDYCASNPGAC
jgi:hypothetical protein